MQVILLLVLLLYSSLPLPCWNQTVDKTLYENGKKLSYYYTRLHQLPVPGKPGSFFQYFQFTQAYRSNNKIGCVFNGVFYGLNQTVEHSCSVLQCLPNDRNNATGALIQKTSDCGPPGPEMVHHLCTYKNKTETQPKQFPQCCPRFDCIHGYDPRRLILPSESPIQTRKFSEVDRWAKLGRSPLDDMPNTQSKVLEFKPYPGRKRNRGLAFRNQESASTKTDLNIKRNRFRKRSGINILNKILGRFRRR